MSLTREKGLIFSKPVEKLCCQRRLISIADFTANLFATLGTLFNINVSVLIYQIRMTIPISKVCCDHLK